MLEKSKIVNIYRKILTAVYKRNGIYVEKELDEICEELILAPLFIFKPVALESSDFRNLKSINQHLELDLIIKDKILLTPYETFMIYIRDEDESKMIDWYILFMYDLENPDTIQFISFQQSNSFDSNGIFSQIKMSYLSEYLKKEISYEELLDRNTILSLLVENVFGNISMYTETDPEHFSHASIAITTYDMHILFYFLQTINDQGNAIVRSFPVNLKNKNTEWQLSKSHYYIIRKNISRIYSGRLNEIIFDGVFKNIKLSAHYRRSHFRNLKSERFKNKKGLKIWIKSSWIGPTEWIGSDKKVYIVI